MIFKATFQETKDQVPLRENTKSIFVQANSKAEARALLDAHTPYNIEFLQEMTDAHLEYERETNPDFKFLEIN